VLVDFGANWCIWCRRLHETLTTNPELRHALAQNYVLVLVDVNRRKDAHRNLAITERYDDPMGHGNGIPVLLVLDAEGKVLVTQETGALENGKGGHDPAKVLAFLEKWAPQG
jgi:thiol:disulfide interchange protein